MGKGGIISNDLVRGPAEQVMPKQCGCNECKIRREEERKQEALRDALRSGIGHTTVYDEVE